MKSKTKSNRQKHKNKIKNEKTEQMRCITHWEYRKRGFTNEIGLRDGLKLSVSVIVVIKGYLNEWREGGSHVTDFLEQKESRAADGFLV